jgi:hypothetical protein
MLCWGAQQGIAAEGLHNSAIISSDSFAMPGQHSHSFAMLVLTRHSKAIGSKGYLNFAKVTEGFVIQILHGRAKQDCATSTSLNFVKV